jgi:hypothetical protein
MKKHYYLTYVIFETLYDHLEKKVFIVQLDMSEHNSLLSAQCHIDYLAK